MNAKEKLEWQREWRKKNPNYHRDWIRAKRKEDPEKFNAYARNWRKANPERAKEIDALNYRNTKKRNPKIRMLGGARDRAKQKGLAFDLTVDDFDIPSHCPVLGIELVPGSHDTRPELDRKIPE